MAYKSMISTVIKDLERGQGKALDKAAAYLVKKLKEKVRNKGISKPGDPPGRRTGDLIKGLRYVSEGKDTRKVGPGKPASHAHLLEFGTGPRIVKNYQGHKGLVKEIPPMAARPFMVPTFDEENDNVQNILSEEWI
jgi:HK97 gp10 family phage protein